METCVVLISVINSNARKTCEQIQNEKFDSRDIARKRIKELLNEEDILCDIDVPESITNQTNLYIEKGINIIIQKTLINNT